MALPHPSVIVDRVRNQGNKTGRVSISMSGLFRVSSGSTKWTKANEPERSFCMITHIPCAPIGNTCTSCIISRIYFTRHPELLDDLRALALEDVPPEEKDSENEMVE
jgi:hypothetical protein